MNSYPLVPVPDRQLLQSVWPREVAQHYQPERIATYVNHRNINYPGKSEVLLPHEQ